MNRTEQACARGELGTLKYLVWTGRFREREWIQEHRACRTTYAYGERRHAMADGFEGIPPKHLWCRRYRAMWLAGWYLRDWLVREGYVTS